MLQIRDFCVVLASVSIASAAMAATIPVNEDFENGTVGQPPAGWNLYGGSPTATATVQSEAGGNQFLALRDTDPGANIGVDLPFTPAPSNGVFQFDIRFNTGFDSEFNIWLMSDPYQPIALQWNSNSYDPNNPLAFRSRGNNEGTGFTSNFPIGTWETIRVEFEGAASGTPRGNYSVTWNGITNNYTYLDQGAGNPFPLNRMVITYQGNTAIVSESIDLDNVIMVVPEPGSLALLGVASTLLLRRRASGR